MRSQVIRTGLAVLLAALVQGPARLRADNPPGWFFGASDDTLNAVGCAAGRATDPTGESYQPCIAFECTRGQGVSVALWSGLNAFPTRAPATVLVDGRPVIRLEFHANRDVPFMPAAPLDRALQKPLVEAMTRGSRIGLAFDDPGLPLPAFADLPLAQAVAALSELESVCPSGARIGAAPAAGAATPEATPDTDPSRFVTTGSVALKDGQGETYARSLLVSEIGQSSAGAGHPVEVHGDLIPFRDGRYLLIATLCDPTWFGITGCETHIFHAEAAGQPFRHSVAGMIGGGPYWLDLKSGVGGWPDILSQPHTGGGAYARMRWTGNGY